MRTGNSVPRTDSTPPSWRALSRRIRLSPRLAILYALPFLGLVAVAFALNYGQWRDVRAIARYEDRAVEALHELELVDALVHERHASYELNAADAIEPATELVDQLSAVLGRSDIAQMLLTDRNRVRSGRVPNVDTYRAVVDDIVGSAERSLANPPTESIAAETSAHIALVRAVEAAHFEDLLIRGNELPFDRATVRKLGEVHQIETSELQSVTLLADPDFANQLVAAPFVPIWRSTIELRNSIVEGTGGTTQREWTATNAARLESLDELVEEHATVTLARVQADHREIQRTALTTSVLTLFVALLGALSFRVLRASILEPISSLQGAIGALIRGEVEPQEATGADEMGEVEESLIELERVMTLLQLRSDDVQAEIGAGNVSARINTDEFSGYWLDRVAAQNQALDEMERAVVQAADTAELGRWITAMRRDAELSTSVEGFISRTAIRLNIAEPGMTLVISSVEPEWVLRPQQAVHDGLIIEAESGPQRWQFAIPVGLKDDQAQALVAARHEQWANPERVTAQLIAISQSLTSLHSRLEQERAQWWSQTHDPVTELLNRRGLELEIEQCEADGGHAAWLVCIGPVDVDLFDEGSSGSNLRNTLLVAFARRLKAAVGDKVTLSRIAETEFVLLGHDGFPFETILELTRAFDRPFLVGGGSIRVDAALGWAHHEHGITGNGLIDASRVACRSSADKRPVTAVEFTPELRQHAARSLELRRWLQSSLDDQTLQVWYQPIIDVGNHSVVGYEALCRGFADGELVSPEEFVPLAEQTGLIDRIGDFVLETALRDVEFLPGQDPYVAVNLSPLQLRDPSIVTRTARTLSDSGVDPSRVVLEITEGAVVDDDPSVLQRLDGLNALGITLSIDDFGTGYSSLAYLSQLPVKAVKLDRSLIARIGKDPSAATVVARTVELAHDLGMSIVAEGVETPEQLEAISAVDADSYQGWHFGRPQPLAHVVDQNSL